MATPDLTLVRHALQVARENNYASLELEFGENTFSAVLEPASKLKKRATSQPEAKVPPGPELRTIKSPVVGYFQIADTEIELEQSVEIGEVVGQISVLGLANEVESPATGRIIEIFVVAGSPVEYGQPLMTIEVQK